jgi:hypothetical protein
MKKIFAGLVCSLLLTSGVYAAVDTTRVGFVSSPLWFDREPFFAGQHVRVYTMLTNSSSGDFSATVEFYDNDTVIGTSTITLAQRGGFQVVWADWTPSEGDHTLSASVINATLTEGGGEPQSIAFVGSSASLPARFVDTDTDGDGIGNRTDTDDDNDGILDVDDADPLVATRESVPEAQNALLESSKNAGNVLQAFIATSTPKIIAVAKAIVSAIDTARTEEGKKLLTQAEIIQEEIKATKELSETTEERKTDPISQIKLLALTTAGYTLSNTILFYVVSAILLYLLLRKVVPWIVRKIRGKDTFE